MKTGNEAMMTTPIYDFLKKFQNKEMVRLFMPGHKGNHPFDPVFARISQYDLTEIQGADALFEAVGIIGESEANASRIFHSKATLYSTQGSTLGIQTMLSLLASRGDTVIAGRNAHMAFCNACTLLRMNIRWILPEASDPYGVRGTVTPEQVEQALKACPNAAGVYLTSPDYLGNTIDLKRIAAICHRYGVPFCCDHAHGAYLIKSPEPVHPMLAGADMCCDSAHKTLPVLTGGAYLHLGENCPWEKEEAKEHMAVFSSTSPSYLILASLDLCNRYLEERGEVEFRMLFCRVGALKQKWRDKGIHLLDNPADFSKLTLDAAACGWDGEELAEHLRKSGIECEYANSCYVVLMASPFLSQTEWELLEQAIMNLPLRPAKRWEAPAFVLPEQVMPAYEAVKQQWERVPLERAVGRVSAQTIAACPPGVPVAVAGERIHEQIKNIYKNSGNFTVKVIK